MDKKSIVRKLAAHNDILGQVLDELSQILVSVLNERGDISELLPAIEKLRETRQIINNTEGLGVIIGIQAWRVAGFPLSGGAEKDISQIVTKIPKNKIN